MPAHPRSHRPGAGTYRHDGLSPVPKGTLPRMVRRSLAMMVRELGRQPDEAFSDACGRREDEQRPLGLIALEHMLVAAWRAGATRESAHLVTEAVREFVDHLYGDDDESLREAFELETRQQAEADVAQARALIDRSPGALDAAIEATGEEIVAKQRLQQELLEERRRLGRQEGNGVLR